MTTSVPVTHRWWALAVLSLAQLMDIVDNSIMNIALPSAQSELGFSVADRQWLITGYALAFGSLLLIGGRLSDPFGRKRMFMIGLGGFAVASAVGDAATGLLLGGLLAETLSCRCLYVNLIFAVLAFLGAIVFLRDGTRPARVRFDAAGAVTAALGLAGIVYELGNAADNGWTDPATLIPTAAGIAPLALFVVIERRAEHPLPPIKVIQDRVCGASYLTLGIAGAGTFVIFLFVTYSPQQTLGISPILTGVAFLPMIGCIMIGTVVSDTFLMSRIGPRPSPPAHSSQRSGSHS